MPEEHVIDVKIIYRLRSNVSKQNAKEMIDDFKHKIESMTYWFDSQIFTIPV